MNSAEAGDTRLALFRRSIAESGMQPEAIIVLVDKDL